MIRYHPSTRALLNTVDVTFRDVKGSAPRLSRKTLSRSGVVPLSLELR